MLLKSLTKHILHLSSAGMNSLRPSIKTSRVSLTNTGTGTGTHCFGAGVQQHTTDELQASEMMMVRNNRKQKPQQWKCTCAQHVRQHTASFFLITISPSFFLITISQCKCCGGPLHQLVYQLFQEFFFTFLPRNE